MASKQLGKLRQWAGEVISSRDKSTVTEEFRELEIDVELRKEGLQRLQSASEAYHHAISKKKDFSALVQGKEKLLPIDALGIVMRNHGEEFGEDSAFGTSLVNLGEAHSKVAALQEAFALTLQDTFLASIKRFGEDIKDYEHQRKKLDSRRLSYDAAISKLDKVKSSKKEKEKDRKDAEDELQTARLRYEETSEDVRVRARAIQENEVQQLRDLTSFIDIEVNFVQQYLEVLQDVKSNWFDTSSLSPVDINRGSGLTHIFLRATDDTKSDIAHSKKSARSSRSNMADSSDSSGDESTETANRTGGNERRSRTGSGPSSRPPSRPTSGASRKRTNSAGGTEKEKSDKAGRRMSMAGWASSAVSSVTGRAKKDKDKFTTLTDDDQSDHDDGDLKRSSSRTSYTNQHLRSKSKDSPANASPKIPIRIFKPLQGKKLVRALYDFTGSTDELAFNAGDEIVVLNEVLDEWWMGELNGQKGLFPTSYTEVIPTSPSKPFAAYRQRIEISPSSTDSPSTQSPLYTDGYITSGLSDSHLFGDPQVVASRSPLWGNFDAESITDSAAEEDEEKRLMPVEQPSGDDDYDRHVRKRSASQPSRPSMLTGRSVPNLITTPASPAKKIPPPPPPRRSASNILAPPPIPQRKQSVFGSRSSGSLCSSSPRSSSVSSLDHGVSPFESATEISMIGCQNFRQNPFKPPGMCSNCSQVHM